MKQKLFLIDAYALIFRFHYAFISNPMRDPAGLNISAVFGFVKFLGELIEREKPHHLGVAFDPKGGNFRHQLYEQYKANRQATPEDIKTAVPIIKEILEAMRIPILEVAGYEADDVIGTLSHKASISGDFETFMVTPDKDYGQLIRSDVHMYKPAKGGFGVEIVRIEDMCAQYGIADPLQVIDILAIWGDASDNIPGVAGIGEKGASKLVAKYGTVEDILAHTSELPPRQRDAIEDGKEQLMLSKALATICLDVPIEFEPEKLVMERADMLELRKIYARHGFAMFLRKLEGDAAHNAFQNGASGTGSMGSLFGTEASAGATSGPTPYSTQKAVQGSLFDAPEEPIIFEAPPRNTAAEGSDFFTAQSVEHKYICVDNSEKLHALVSELKTQSRIAIDTETTSVNAMQCEMVGFSVAFTPHTAYWVPTPKNERVAILDAIRPIMEDETIEKIGQNIKYDLLVLRNNGIELKGAISDTMIMHYLLDSDARHSMDYMARNFLNYNPIPIEELIGKGAKQLTMDLVAKNIIAEYAAEDADITLQLFSTLQDLVKERKQIELYKNIEEPLITVLADMEFNGVKIDTDILGESAITLNAQLLDIEKDITAAAGNAPININSPKQLGELLFETLKIDEKAKKTKTGQYKTDEQTLAAIAHKHPIIGKILEYRGIKKLLSTYVEALPTLINPKTGRIHTSFNQATTSTGRLSSSNPNLQNIPIREAAGREIRRAFVPEKQGWIIIAADYSQIELRIMAHLSGDTNMQSAFVHDMDIHTATAAKIFGVNPDEVTKEQRRRAKTANFGIIYGISAFGLAQRLEIPRGEARELIENYFAQYPDVKKYMETIVEQARKQGYVETIFARRRYLHDISSANGTMRSLAERNAINAPIQGSAADIIKIAMVKVHKAIKTAGLRAKMILQVHDEIVIEAPADELSAVSAILKSEMESAVSLSVPLTVDVGSGINWLDAH